MNERTNEKMCLRFFAAAALHHPHSVRPVWPAVPAAASSQTNKMKSNRW